MSRSRTHQLDFRNTNTLWCSTLVEVLARMGATQAVVCPGSRSAPLTIALARHPLIEAVPVLDERSAGFFALGLARRSRRPTILVCTSGTAAANFLPAVVEAHESRVPLLVITADRPPELRECRSGQTIDQQKIYGDHAGFYHETALPEASVAALRYLRQTSIAAWERTLHPVPGPVHLNMPFRDPLAPVRDGLTRQVAAELDPADFFRMLPQAPAEHPALPAAELAPVADAGGLAFPSTVTRGLIVAGPAQPRSPLEYCRCVEKISQTLHWPVLADALSPLRNFARLNPTLVSTYDTFLRSTRVRRSLRPDLVLCLGGWPTSKQLRAWLQQLDAETLVVEDDFRNADALHVRSRALRVPVETLARALNRPHPVDAHWLRAWRTTEEASRRLLARAVGSQRALFEGRIAWQLSQDLPRGTTVFLASSMPVRDAEYFWTPNNGEYDVYFNRGANGIDGTLSTALGVAHRGFPAVLLTGDLALLHDTNGWLITPKLRGSLTVVVANNNGGGIFEHLPVAAFEPPFEEYFATPQRVDFARVAAAYDIEHVQVRGWTHFRNLISNLPRRGVRIIELRTDRKRDARRRNELFAAVAERIDRALR